MTSEGREREKKQQQQRLHTHFRLSLYFENNFNIGKDNAQKSKTG